MIQMITKISKHTIISLNSTSIYLELSNLAKNFGFYSEDLNTFHTKEGLHFDCCKTYTVICFIGALHVQPLLIVCEVLYLRLNMVAVTCILTANSAM